MLETYCVTVGKFFCPANLGPGVSSLSLSLCCPTGCHLALLGEVSGITISNLFAFDFWILTLKGLLLDFLLVPIRWGTFEENVRGGSKK